MKPSSAAVLDRLREAGPEGATSLELWRAGAGSRAAARVADLEADGYRIESELVQVETAQGTARVSRYRLLSEPSALPARRPSPTASAAEAPDCHADTATGAAQAVRYGRPIGRPRWCPSCRDSHPAGVTCAQPV